MVSAAHGGGNKQQNRGNGWYLMCGCSWWRSCYQGWKGNGVILVQVAPTLLLALPAIRRNFVVQLGQAGPMKREASVGECELRGDLVRLNWRESLNPRLLEGVCSDWFVELSKMHVRPVDWLKWHQLGRMRRQIQSVFLFFAAGVMTVLQLIGCTFKDSADAPRSSKGKLQLVNSLFSGRQSDGVLGKDNVANGINARIWPARVDILAMVGALFLHKQFRNKATCQQPRCKVFQVGDNCSCR